MFNPRIFAAAFAVAASLPLLAGASTLNPSNDIVDGGSYDMFGPHFFAEAFRVADEGGTREFTFTNSDATNQNLILTTATVNALSTMFTGGVTFEWVQSGLSLFVPQSSKAFAGELDNTIGAGSFDTLRVSFGDPEPRPNASTGGKAHFSLAFDSAPATVPLPAGGLLLLGALGGIAALRRRRSAV